MLRPLVSHTKCLNNIYPRSNVKRLPMDDNLKSWNSLGTYDPPFYESPQIENKPWADPPILKFSPLWNSIDGKVNRMSHNGKYTLDAQNRPQNIVGRTGLCGRGELGRWGPNHAADPIVTRWKMDDSDEKVKNDSTGRWILEMIAIKRRDNGEWAIPGGMVDPGETVSAALKREFTEEALNFESNNVWDKFLQNGVHIYSGYVDDPRNTDNAWMETIVYNYHCSDNSLKLLKLNAGSDASNVRWLELNSEIDLYASHKEFVKAVSENLNAHW